MQDMVDEKTKQITVELKKREVLKKAATNLAQTNAGEIENTLKQSIQQGMLVNICLYYICILVYLCILSNFFSYCILETEANQNKGLEESNAEENNEANEDAATSPAPSTSSTTSTTSTANTQ